MPIGIGRGRGSYKAPKPTAPGLNGDKADSNERNSYHRSDNDNNIRTVSNHNRNEHNDNTEVLEIQRKVTYVPDDDQADYNMFTNSGINFDNYDSIKVNVTGTDCPKSLSTIEELDLPKFLLNNISELGFKQLTPVQKCTIPMMLKGRDFIACAQTGSGKTAAFLFPIIKSVYEEKLKMDEMSKEIFRTSPGCIILVPTRELCRQAFTFCKLYTKGSNIIPSYCYGGIQVGYSIAKVRNSDILAVTPGRLVFLLREKIISLDRTKYLILDEADKLLKAESFSESIELLFQTASANNSDGNRTFKYQVAMFSATFPSEIQYYAKSFLREYLFVSVGQVGEACSDIKQTIIKTSYAEKLEQALEFIKHNDTGKTLIFVCSKRQADFYGLRLVTMDKRATTIHGDRDQCQREMALNDFKSDRVQFLVATDVASRGLDIPRVDTVINVDMPEDIDVYVHRIGRTGRCGNVGSSISFFDEERDMRLVTGLIRILRAANQIVPDWLAMIESAADGRIFVDEKRGRQRANQDTREGVQKNTFIMNGRGNGKLNNNAAPPITNGNDDDEDW